MGADGGWQVHLVPHLCPLKTFPFSRSVWKVRSLWTGCRNEGRKKGKRGVKIQEGQIQQVHHHVWRGQRRHRGTRPWQVTPFPVGR